MSTIETANASPVKLISNGTEVATAAPLPVIVISGGGGGSSGTEYVEDAVAPANPTGGVLMSVRKDTLSVSEVSADGDIVAVKATNKGQLHVYSELAASALVIGKVGIDQTTDGTTNLVAAKQSGTWNIGTITTLPALATGANAIGSITNTGFVSTGNVASAAADSGNPVKIGGIYQTTLPTFTTGQRGDAQVDSKGNLRVRVVAGGNATAGDGVSNTVMETQSDATTQNTSTLYKPVWGFVFNGTTWDRQYSVANGMNSTGTGIAASGIIGHFDDTSTGAVTENQFAPVRINSSRELKVNDAAAITLLGPVTETAPASDTASSGINGRLQRIAQNLSTMIADTTAADVNLTKINGTAISNTNPMPVKQVGDTPYFNSAVGSTKYLVVAGAYNLSSYFLENPDATNKCYVQIFDAATIAAVTLGTTVPKWSIALAALEKANLAGLNLSFASGIVIAGTTTSTGSTTAVTGAVANLGYRAT